MARKRRAPTSQQIPAQKPKIVSVEEEEEETSDESSEEESEEKSSSSNEESEEEEESESEDEEEEASSSEEDETDEASKRESLRQLLEPFGKSQIIDFLQNAAAKDPKLLSKILEKVDSDPTHRNIFVYGLGWDATSEQLLQAFKPYGEIEDCKVITDRNTGRPKGYAFVLFKTRNAARKALKAPQKKIGSRMVSCQLAATGNPGMAAAEGGNLKVYVGNVGPQINPEKLKAYFRRYGEIEDGPMGLDQTTNKFKGFAVITYKTAEGYKKAMEEPVKVFENAQLHCKKYIENMNKSGGASGAGSVSSVTPAANDVSYGNLGVNPGILGAHLNAGRFFMAPNPGTGLPGDGMFAAGYNPTGLVASGLSTPTAGVGGNYGIGGLGPSALGSVMGSYGSQAALNGLGAFQNAQTGQSAVGSTVTTTTATRVPPSGAPASMGFPSYYGL